MLAQTIKYINKVNTFLKLLKENPRIGKSEIEDKGIRGYVLSRQTTVLYRIKGETIIILKFFDNRQNPKKKI